MNEYDIDTILNILPHRFPFLLVDRVIKVIPGEKLIAIKNVTINEPFFPGHFPGIPIMPGVLILEALAQTAGLLDHFTSLAQDPNYHSPLTVLAGIDNARFKQKVIPGDQLQLEVQALKQRRDVSKFHAQAFVENKLVCSADFMSARTK